MKKTTEKKLRLGKIKIASLSKLSIGMMGGSLLTRLTCETCLTDCRGTCPPPAN